MLESEKRNYPLYRINKDRIARMVGLVRMAIYMTSDRRVEDNDHLCVYLKKSYGAVCDRCDIREADIVRLEDDERVRVISVTGDDSELLLHLESVKILDTGSFDFEEDSNV